MKLPQAHAYCAARSVRTPVRNVRFRERPIFLAMTDFGRFQSVRFAARKLPVGFRQRWSCSDRLNVATWWKADVHIG